MVDDPLPPAKDETSASIGGSPKDKGDAHTYGSNKRKKADDDGFEEVFDKKIALESHQNARRDAAWQLRGEGWSARIVSFDGDLYDEVQRFIELQRGAIGQSTLR